VACLPAHAVSLDVVEIAAAHGVAVTEAARVYFEVGAQVGLDWLAQEVERLPAAGAWQGVARQGLREGLLRTGRRLAQAVLARKHGGDPRERVSAWLAATAEWPHWQSMLAQMRTVAPSTTHEGATNGTRLPPAPDFATLSVGIEAVRKLGQQGTSG
jgi:glutamate dehydrogenase